jgi:mannose-6-phosphate isomerase-like protein (cupin superfamily)
MDINRREIGLLMPFLAALANTSHAEGAGNLPGRGYEYSELPVKTNGPNQSRDVFKGTTHSGFPIDLHITDLGPGAAPHPPHHHVHEEVIFIRSGSLEVTMSGKTTTFGPGSVIYAASGEEHGWKNPGPGRSEYFVLALGRDA